MQLAFPLVAIPVANAEPAHCDGAVAKAKPVINLYLSAVDDLLRHPDDKPSVGLLLCRSRNKLVAEYALRGLKKPIGVAEWETKIVANLPSDLKGSLPTVEEIEAELGGDSLSSSDKDEV